MYDERFVAELARIAVEEKITTRKAVMNMTAFSERAWSAHKAFQATADAAAGRASA